MTASDLSMKMKRSLFFAVSRLLLLDSDSSFVSSFVYLDACFTAIADRLSRRGKPETSGG
jgi:hypothetical protein